MRDYSQHGETWLIDSIVHILERAGSTVVPRIAVEFGAGDGYHLSNIRGLMEEGWKGVQWDKEPKGMAVAFRNITTENVNRELMFRYRADSEIGVLSIDIDGNDYWIWKALVEYHPYIVVIEFNPTLDGCWTIPYDPEHVWVGDNYFGASFGAMVKLGHSKGYKAVAKTPCNLIFVREDLWLGPEAPIPHKPDTAGWKITDKKFQEVL